MIFAGRSCLLVARLYGRAARCKPKVMIWRSWSCASVFGLLMERLSSWPSWISARARSHSRLGPEGPMGHLITNALARPFSISSFQLADLGGKPTLASGISLSRQPSLGELERVQAAVIVTRA